MASAVNEFVPKANSASPNSEVASFTVRFVPYSLYRTGVILAETANATSKGYALTIVLSPNPSTQHNATAPAFRDTSPVTEDDAEAMRCLIERAASLPLHPTRSIPINDDPAF